MKINITSSTTTIDYEEIFPYLRLNAGDNGDKVNIPFMIDGAVSYIERETGGFVFGTKEVEITYNLFDQYNNGWVKLPHTPIKEITSVTVNGVDVTYQEMQINQLGTTKISVPIQDGLVIKYTCGDEPGDLRDVVKLLVGNSNEHREATITGTFISQVPFGVKEKIGNYNLKPFIY